MNIRILKTKGLNWYLDFAVKLGYEDFFKRKYVNKCDLCRNIFSDIKFMDNIVPYIEDEKKRIFEKYCETIKKND